MNKILRKLMFFRKPKYYIKFIVVYLDEQKLDDGAVLLQDALNDDFSIFNTHPYESYIVYEMYKKANEKR